MFWMSQMLIHVISSSFKCPHISIFWSIRKTEYQPWYESKNNNAWFFKNDSIIICFSTSVCCSQALNVHITLFQKFHGWTEPSFWVNLLIRRTWNSICRFSSIRRLNSMRRVVSSRRVNPVPRHQGWHSFNDSNWI